MGWIWSILKVLWGAFELYEDRSKVEDKVKAEEKHEIEILKDQRDNRITTIDDADKLWGYREDNPNQH